MPSLAELGVLLAISGVVSYGVTQVIKLACGKWIGRDVNSSDPWLWQSAFRLIPLLLGAGVGWAFPYEFPWGVAVGTSGGILSVLLYKKVERLIDEFKS